MAQMNETDYKVTIVFPWDDTHILKIIKPKEIDSDVKTVYGPELHNITGVKLASSLPLEQYIVLDQYLTKSSKLEGNLSIEMDGGSALYKNFMSWWEKLDALKKNVKFYGLYSTKSKSFIHLSSEDLKFDEPVLYRNKKDAENTLKNIKYYFADNIFVRPIWRIV